MTGSFRVFLTIWLSTLVPYLALYEKLVGYALQVGFTGVRSRESVGAVRVPAGNPSKSEARISRCMLDGISVSLN